MCEPVSISAGVMWAMVAIGAATAGAAAYSAREQGKAQSKALSEANQIRADQISKQAGAEMMETSRDARRDRGLARATASEAGINLGSNSFLAILQNSMFNEQFDNGLVAYNAEAAQEGRQSEYSSRMASINIPTSLGIGLAAFNGGMQGYRKGAGASARGGRAATGG